MRLKTIYNKEVNINIYKYRVQWDKLCRSKFQFNVKQILRPYLINHVVVEEMAVPGTRLRLDLLDLTTKILFESNGEQHRSYNEFFSRNRVGYLRSLQRDAAKLKWCDLNEITLVEIYPEDLAILSPSWFLDRYGITI